MNNLYWPIYKNLEREILNLADVVHFSDKQVNVYSVRIADIIVRCSVEIESIINDLYKGATGAKGKDSIGAQLTFLNEKWRLAKKQVTITSLNMHFSEVYSTFSPFSYEKSDANDYYSAYNAIKHDRVANFETKATIHYLLRSLAALFVLNIYFKNEEQIYLSKNRTLGNTNFGSDIFSAHTIIKTPDKYTGAVAQSSEDQKALYIIKAAADSYERYLDEVKRAHRLKIQALPSEIRDKIDEKKEKDDGEDNIQFKYDTNFIELAKSEEMDTSEFVRLVQKISDIDSKSATFLSTVPYEAVLNKNQIIYPDIKEEK